MIADLFQVIRPEGHKVGLGVARSFKGKERKKFVY